MFPIFERPRLIVGHLAISSLLAGSLLSPGSVSAESSVRVVGCNPTSLSAEIISGGTNVVAPIEEADGEEDDALNVDESTDQQQPYIQGTIPKPRGVSEDNSRALTSLATVSREAATATAMKAVSNPDQRIVKKVVVEGENGFVVWAVKTELKSGVTGPDPKVEIKVDAGGAGGVLSIECDPADS